MTSDRHFQYRRPSHKEPNDKAFAGLPLRAPTSEQKKRAGQRAHQSHRERKLGDKLDQLLGPADYDGDDW